MSRILVGGLGNIFLGDDGFGVEVLRRLGTRPLPPDVELRDFGIRGLDLTYALLDGYDAVILIDISRRGELPGTVTSLEIEPRSEALTLDLHGCEPHKAMSLASHMGGRLPQLYLVACEPADIPSSIEDGREPSVGLSEAVGGAVENAIEMVLNLARQLTSGEVSLSA
jgi:hydrogenase maturation protease